MLALFGTLAVLFRQIFSAADRLTQQSILAKVKRDPSKAAVYADALDMPYTVLRGISGDALMHMRNSLVPGVIIADFTILYSCSVGLHRLLVFTELSTMSYEINIYGSASDTLKKVQHNFVLQHDVTEETLTIFSNIYSNNDEKFQKFAFLKPKITDHPGGTLTPFTE